MKANIFAKHMNTILALPRFARLNIVVALHLREAPQKPGTLQHLSPQPHDFGLLSTAVLQLQPSMKGNFRG